MQVKVGDAIFDSDVEPVMVILTETEKSQIANMSPKSKKFCAYPDIEHWTRDDFSNIKKWMGEQE